MAPARSVDGPRPRPQVLSASIDLPPAACIGTFGLVLSAVALLPMLLFRFLQVMTRHGPAHRTNIAHYITMRLDISTIVLGSSLNGIANLFG
jgi:hypothetical protein